MKAAGRYAIVAVCIAGVMGVIVVSWFVCCYQGRKHSDGQADHQKLLLQDSIRRSEELQKRIDDITARERLPCAPDAGTIRVLQERNGTKQWCDCDCRQNCRCY
jgi:hypothetical protein